MESSSKSIAHEIGGGEIDALRFGLNGVKSDIIASHPLQSLHESIKKNQEDSKRAVLATTYGSAFPLKMDLDRQILSRFQRPPGLPSSMLGYDALTGGLDDFQIKDYFIDPQDSESFRPPDMHHGMEVHLGISKGRVCPGFI
ncbi:Cyclin-B1-2 [Acorus gramineus]|uniref:Cyclin-B1-2 n=1 Tax=Acorus gramineus TaxID=55184 RepID=A0AAV9AWA9_ACOGR|nr:Cyclin-B1-2 [Acorus gramineus]